MSFPELKEAEFKERLNRFVGLVELKGKTFSAYIRNTGRLKELLYAGNRVFLAERGTGKHPFEIVLAEYEEHLVCIDAHITPKLYAESLCAPVIFEPSFEGVRFDLLLEERPVEVKSVNLVRKGVALFPDAPTKRGKRHLEKLIELSKRDYNPLLVFVVQREDGEFFSPNWEVDPDFSKALLRYISLGLEVRAYRCSVNLKEIKLKEEIPVILEGMV
ncbi:MAG: DNA/RNA nuclease SfsA [Aquificaceae bacterium]|nr:DNA/RNA nuclease SfsA [Aquificaceae bacterium]